MESDFEIIENTVKAQEKFGLNYGSETKFITRHDLEALLNGKQLATEINGR